MNDIMKNIEWSWATFAANISPILSPELISDLASYNDEIEIDYTDALGKNVRVTKKKGEGISEKYHRVNNYECTFNNNIKQFIFADESQSNNQLNQKGRGSASPRGFGSVREGSSPKGFNSTREGSSPKGFNSTREGSSPKGFNFNGHRKDRSVRYHESSDRNYSQKQGRTSGGFNGYGLGARTYSQESLNLPGVNPRNTRVGVEAGVTNGSNDSENSRRRSGGDLRKSADFGQMKSKFSDVVRMNAMKK
jgi:hypothetical protein